MIEAATTHETPKPSRALEWQWWVLALIVTALCLNHLGGYRPLTHHEVYVAQSAREMQASGNWLLPTYFGAPRYQKPPLAYWETLLSYTIFGSVNEWTARLPAAFTAILFALFVATRTAQRYGPEPGRLTGFILATSVYFLIQSRLAEADITVAFAVAVACFLYGELADPTGPRRVEPKDFAIRKVGQTSPNCRSNPVRQVWFFWLAVAVAMLAKGPVGPLIVFTILTSHALLLRNWQGARQLLRSLPILTTFGLTLAWPIAMVWQDNAAASVWIQESAGRFLRDPNDVVRHPFYYPAASLWLTLPWTPVWLYGLLRSIHPASDGIDNQKIELPPARRVWYSSRELWRRARSAIVQGDSFELLLLLWFFVPMALLSLSAGKQEHYLIPALTPCSLWGARGLIHLSSRIATTARFRWWEAGLWLLQTRPRRRAAGALLVGAILFLQSVVLPEVHGRRSYADWAEAALHASPGSAPTILVGHSVQWLTFYVPTPTVRCDTLDELFALGVRPGTRIVATDADAAAIQQHFPVTKVAQAPWDGHSSLHKRPTLLRLEHSLQSLAN